MSLKQDNYSTITHNSEVYSDLDSEHNENDIPIDDGILVIKVLYNDVDIKYAIENIIKNKKTHKECTKDLDTENLDKYSSKFLLERFRDSNIYHYLHLMIGSSKPNMYQHVLHPKIGEIYFEKYPNIANISRSFYLLVDKIHRGVSMNKCTYVLLRLKSNEYFFTTDDELNDMRDDLNYKNIQRRIIIRFESDENDKMLIDSYKFNAKFLQLIPQHELGHFVYLISR